MFWGLAAITAAEIEFADSSSGYSWLALAQGVYNTQVDRWDDSTCGGGLRWQIYPYEAGYAMKNSISNGGLFQLAARLARYTSNDTYADWAEKIFDWCASTPLLNNQTWNVADSTDVDNNCKTQGNNQWSYNYGVFLTGAAYMYNYVSNFGFPPGVEEAGANLMPFADRQGQMEERGGGSLERDARHLLPGEVWWKHHVRNSLRTGRSVQRQRNSVQGTRHGMAWACGSDYAVDVQSHSAKTAGVRRSCRSFLQRNGQQHLWCALVSQEVGWVERNGGRDRRHQRSGLRIV